MNTRNKFIILGGLAGLAVGASVAWAYLESQENGLWTKKRVDGREMVVHAGTSDFMRIGMSVWGVVRQFQKMAKRA